MHWTICLYSLDTHWREHLAALDHLRQGIHLRGYAQKDPKREFQTEAFNLFAIMLDSIKSDAVRVLLTAQIKGIDESIDTQADQTDNKSQDGESQQTNNISRNAPCFCGSGKKYKHCHGKLA